MNKARKFITDKIKTENSEAVSSALLDLLSLIGDESITDVVSSHCIEFEPSYTIEDLAEFLHQIRCHSNHIDQCSWEYESWDNPGNTRKRYLDKARQLLSVHNIEIKEAHEYIKIYKDMSKILRS